jgi:hypothetical protein
MNSPIKHFYFPESILEVEEGALYYCTRIEVVFIPNSTTTIADSAFEGCNHLIFINIPNSIHKIGKNAFKGCELLNCNLAIERKADFEFTQTLIFDAKLPIRCLKACVNVCSCKLHSKFNNNMFKVIFVITVH